VTYRCNVGGRKRRHRVSAWTIKALSPLAAFALPFLWFYYHVPAIVIFWASLALLIYYLFAAPSICGVMRSGGKGTCDEDTHGVLRACWRQAHKRKERQQILRRLRHPMTHRPPGTTGMAVVRPTVGPGPMPAYAPPARSSRLHIETVLSTVEVTISALALIASLLAWRFPVT